jgi:hypothetical protein
VDELKSSGKSFEISKWEVWEAYRQVKANQGAPGVDGVTLEQFDADLKNQLYRIWNRMSSGTYFPPAVKAVQIPKSHGGGTRTLGVPTVTAKCRAPRQLFGSGADRPSVSCAGWSPRSGVVRQAAWP